MALWTPAEIATYRWYDPSTSSTLYDATTGGSPVAGGGAVARFEDKLGRTPHLLQSTLGARPIRSVAGFGGLDALVFDGISQFMESTTFAAAIPQPLWIWTCFYLPVNAIDNADIVATQTSFMVVRPKWSGAVDSALMFAGGVFLRPNITAGNHIWGVKFNGASSVSRYQGVQSATGDAGTRAFPEIRIGRGGGTAAYLSATYGEIIITGDLPLDDVERIEGYMAWRRGLQGLLPANHPYKNAAPTTSVGIIPILRQHYAAQGAR
jgi:hypothetical protein